MSALEVAGLAVSYGATEALRGIDLSVAEGETVCLLGANGAGKTTTLRALSGQVRVRAGRIRFAGADIAGMRPHRIAARGLVQVPEGRQVFAALTVAENLALGAWTLRDAAEAGQRRARVLARFPRLAERLRQKAGSLSGGEQQMLAIGRALMAGPKLLLLDEPSMGLAPLVVEEIFAVIAELKAEGVTLLLVEQNASAALEIADRAYVLENGRITLAGPAWKVARDPAVAAAYLGG
jgi:branched-chain amino acid transport system ATP-binding protein